MSGRKLAVVAGLVVVGVAAFGQEVKPGAVRLIGAHEDVSGEQAFLAHCASCHGLDGKGGGPVAPSLKQAVPDLTLISRRNQGQFPAFRITHIIDGSETLAVHGTKEMPIWGDYFRDNDERDEAILKLREHNLTEFVRSIQRK